MSTLRKFLTPAQKQILASQQQYKCRSCFQLLPSTWQVDHLIPLHKGGTNNWDNLQILCPNCHASKTQLEAIHRESVAAGRSSPFFPPPPSASPPPPPFVLRRHCKAPTITLSFSEP